MKQTKQLWNRIFKSKSKEEKERLEREKEKEKEKASGAGPAADQQVQKKEEANASAASSSSASVPSAAASSSSTPPPISGNSTSSPPLLPTSAELAEIESAARQHLADCSAAREVTLCQASEFMQRLYAAFNQCLTELSSLSTNRDQAEESLIAAESKASSNSDLLSRLEDTRRFLVSRVRCAAWEKKSHFHLTSLDHALGHEQPALFDVAAMLRGHLSIAALAKQAVNNTKKMQEQIKNQLEIKESAFKRAKELTKEIELASKKIDEYKLLLRQLKKEMGGEIERYIKKKRLSRSSSISPLTRSNSSVTSPASGAGATALPLIQENAAAPSADQLLPPPLFPPSVISSPPPVLPATSSSSSSSTASAFSTFPFHSRSQSSPPSSFDKNLSSDSPSSLSPPSASASSSSSPSSSSSSAAATRSTSHARRSSGPVLGDTSSSSAASSSSPSSTSPPRPGFNAMLEADIWTSEFAAFATQHVEQSVSSQHHGKHGFSSHAVEDKTGDISPPAAKAAKGQIKISSSLQVPTSQKNNGSVAEARTASAPAAVDFASAVDSNATSAASSPSSSSSQPPVPAGAEAESAAGSASSARSAPASPDNASPEAPPTEEIDPASGRSSPSTSPHAAAQNKKSYVRLKMRYFQQVLSVRGTPPASSPHSPSSLGSSGAISQRTMSAAAALAAKRAARKDEEKKKAAAAASQESSETEDTKNDSDGNAGSDSPSLPSSPSSALLGSATTPSAPLVSEAPAIRSRPLLSRSPSASSPPSSPSSTSSSPSSGSPSSADIHEHKRWMLRALPATVSWQESDKETEVERRYKEISNYLDMVLAKRKHKADAAGGGATNAGDDPNSMAAYSLKLFEQDELQPLHDDAIYSGVIASAPAAAATHSSSSAAPAAVPPSPSHSTSTSALMTPYIPSSPSSSPAAKKHWWSGLMKPFSATHAAHGKLNLAQKGKEKEGEEKDKKEKAPASAEAKEPALTPASAPASSPSLLEHASSSPASSSSSAATGRVVSAGASASVPSPSAASLLSSEWSSLSSLIDSLESQGIAIQTAWEKLESILDRRERVQAEERKQKALQDAKEAEEKKEREQKKADEPPASPSSLSIDMPSTPRTRRVPSSHAFSSVSNADLLPASSSLSSTPPSARTYHDPIRIAATGNAAIPNFPLSATSATSPAASASGGTGGENPDLMSIPLPIQHVAAVLKSALKHAALSRSQPSTPPPSRHRGGSGSSERATFFESLSTSSFGPLPPGVAAARSHSAADRKSLARHHPAAATSSTSSSSASSASSSSQQAPHRQFHLTHVEIAKFWLSLEASLATLSSHVSTSGHPSVSSTSSTASSSKASPSSSSSAPRRSNSFCFADAASSEEDLVRLLMRTREHPPSPSSLVF